MNIPELIGVLELAQEGRQLQMLIDGQWKDFDAVDWVKGFTQFRASPEPRKPREWNVPLGIPVTLYGNETTGMPIRSETACQIRVREVIE